VAPWQARVVVVRGGVVSGEAGSVRRFVGVPGMNAVCRHLASKLDVSYGTRVEALKRDDDTWALEGADGDALGRFDVVVVSAPAPQASALLKPCSPDLAARADSVEMAPCWAVMVTFPEALNFDYDGAFVHDSAISWVSRNPSKPDRPDRESWVIHASPEWSTANLELEPERAADILIGEFRDALGATGAVPVYRTAHRWRFALPLDPLPEPFLLDIDRGLAACGDWCGGPRVEGAYLSGRAAAEAILAR
jgi:predicted NAD/FAD-dependent oxidoreductase